MQRRRRRSYCGRRMEEDPMRESEDKVLWIWLRLVTEGNVRWMNALYETLGSVQDIYKTTDEEYIAMGVGEHIRRRLNNKDLKQAYDIFGICEKFGIGMVDITDAAYPELLRHITAPPCLLFYDGRFAEAFSHPTLTVIGTRHSTASGEASAAEFARGLAASGFTVVCGVADGIEQIIHRSVMEIDGRCVQVLPCGLLKAGKRVAHMIRDTVVHGAVVTECLPNEVRRFDAYPLRNRILSGLSHGTLVIQAPKKSGAIMTAGYAAEQGRDVFVLPGSVRDPSYSGNNALLVDGAHPVIAYDDLVDFYREKFPEDIREVDRRDETFETFLSSVTESAPREFENEEQQAIYSVLSDGAHFVEEVMRQTGLTAQQVFVELSRMEFYGWIEALPGGTFKTIS